ncbi:hypothetical protein [Pseudemcibacter aquimaris]|uniref:ATP-binding protein n=1 Tax=Pseudemcibacter aquimaris TaxID=2857064 RepID=UPI0020130479|nr:hypothetical protein [Pseudemcibacter aquimaris]MCC3860523.1 hypothetical protein [Pseudemcibacter aquimaris]WDU59348.1 hypothetical protein KW060_03600 [Pseudemcibacter aquimaris]
MEIKINNLKVFHGPSIYLSKKAVVLEYELPIKNYNFSENDFNNMKSVLPDHVANLVITPELFKQKNIPQLMKILLCNLLNLKGNREFFIEDKINDNQNHTMVVQFFDEVVIKIAINIMMTIINHSLANGKTNTFQLKQHISMAVEHLISEMPGNVIRIMQEEAIERNIPFYPVGNKPTVYLYGQGSQGIIYDHSSNRNDSVFGYFLSRSKLKTCQFIRTLGFPATIQLPVRTFDDCIRAADQIGYPVVVKPNDGERGNGITTNIQNVQSLKAAYEKSNNYSDGNNIVENFIPGTNYRFTISQGKLNSAYVMMAAQVRGDGSSSISALIEVDNVKRSAQKDIGMGVKELIQDQKMSEILNYNGYSFDTVPKKGEVVMLGDVTNLASGGSYERIPHDIIHEDVKEMMFDIVNALSIDNVGIDYISEDISKSWRETGTIIEVNIFISMEKTLAANIFNNHFSNEKDARVRTILVVSNSDQKAKENYTQEFNKCRNFGFVSLDNVLFRNSKMLMNEVDLYNRCRGLLLNPNCEGLFVFMTPEQILRQGLPLDSFELAIIDQNCDLSVWKKEYGICDLNEWLDMFCTKIDNNSIDEMN